MTLRELYSIPYIEEEIQDYKDKIRDLEEMAERITAQLTGMPSSGKVSDKVGDIATAIAFYKSFLESAIVKKITTEIEITKYIETIEDAEIRRIMWLRFIERKTWREVADKIGGYNTEDGVRKRCNRFVEKHGGTSDMSVQQAI